MVAISNAIPGMKARKSEKKKARASRKNPSSGAARTHRSTRARGRRKDREDEGVIELFVSTYQSLG